MMRTIKTLACATVIAVTFSACNGTTAPANSDYESLPADQVMYGMEHEMSTAGVRSAHLKADTALVFNDSARIHLRKVDLELFTEQGSVRATLTSVSGELDQNSQKMIARGNVVLKVVGRNGRTIYTEELHYDPNVKQVWSDVRTRMVFPDGRTSTVDSFRTDEQFENFTLQGLRGAAPGNMGF